MLLGRLLIHSRLLVVKFGGGGLKVILGFPTAQRVRHPKPLCSVRVNYTQKTTDELMREISTTHNHKVTFKILKTKQMLLWLPLFSQGMFECFSNARAHSWVSAMDSSLCEFQNNFWKSFRERLLGFTCVLKQTRKPETSQRHVVILQLLAVE